MIILAEKLQHEPVLSRKSSVPTIMELIRQAGIKTVSRHFTHSNVISFLDNDPYSNQQGYISFLEISEQISGMGLIRLNIKAGVMRASLRDLLTFAATPTASYLPDYKVVITGSGCKINDIYLIPLLNVINGRKHLRLKRLSDGFNSTFSLMVKKAKR